MAMQDCPECRRDLVYPTEWWEASGTHWWVTLRCPECEWGVTGRYNQVTVDAFDDFLELAAQKIERVMLRLGLEVMAMEAEGFVSSLAVDAILPEDF